MTEYEKTLEDIKKTMGVVLDQFKAIPPEALPFEWELMKRFAFSETKIPAKYRELIGLAVASSIKCPYCVHFHTRAAKMNGATDEEIAEVAFLTRFTTGWSAILHTANIDLDRFKRQLAEAEAYMTKQAKQKR
jgi:AhpD family alkylhydroperoxidase